MMSSHSFIRPGAKPYDGANSLQSVPIVATKRGGKVWQNSRWCPKREIYVGTCTYLWKHVGRRGAVRCSESGSAG